MMLTQRRNEDLVDALTMCGGSDGATEIKREDQTLEAKRDNQHAPDKTSPAAANKLLKKDPIPAPSHAGHDRRVSYLGQRISERVALKCDGVADM